MQKWWVAASKRCGEHPAWVIPLRWRRYLGMVSYLYMRFAIALGVFAFVLIGGFILLNMTLSWLIMFSLPVIGAVTIAAWAIFFDEFHDNRIVPPRES
jgi:hypothetical protein